jgi:phosphatidate cytidylyltransferase
MLRSRLLAGSVLAFSVMLAVYLDMVYRMDIIFLVMATVGMAIVLKEFYDLCRHKGLTPFVGFGIVMGVLLFVLRWVSLPGTVGMFVGVENFPDWLRFLMQRALLLALVAAVFGALWLQATKRDNAATFESISTTLFGLLYVSFLGGFLLDIGRLGCDGIPGGLHWWATGGLCLLTTVTVTKVCDIGAFTFGRLFGKHKMIPRISPNKTYEGAVGGLLFSIGGAVIFYLVGLFPLQNMWTVVLFGFVVGMIGIFGDLAESLLKRGSGAKDSGTLVPGFGGLLDVVDSMLLSTPVAYVMLVLMLGG